MAEAWLGYDQEINTEKSGAMPNKLEISKLICFKVPRITHCVC